MKRIIFINLLIIIMVSITLYKMAESFANGFSKGLNKVKMKFYKVTKLSPFFTLSQQGISNEEIIEVVAAFFDLSNKQLIQNDRRRRVLFPRQIAIWFCVNNNISQSPSLKNPKIKWEKLAERFNKENHATMIHSFRTIENLIETDRKVRNIIQVISGQIECKSSVL